MRKIKIISVFLLVGITIIFTFNITQTKAFEEKKLDKIEVGEGTNSNSVFSFKYSSNVVVPTKEDLTVDYLYENGYIKLIGPSGKDVTMASYDNFYNEGFHNFVEIEEIEENSMSLRWYDHISGSTYNTKVSKFNLVNTPIIDPEKPINPEKPIDPEKPIAPIDPENPNVNKLNKTEIGEGQEKSAFTFKYTSDIVVPAGTELDVEYLYENGYIKLIGPSGKDVTMASYDNFYNEGFHNFVEVEDTEENSMSLRWYDHISGSTYNTKVSNVNIMFI